jgi:hypothetical protein
MSAFDPELLRAGHAVHFISNPPTRVGIIKNPSFEGREYDDESCGT